MQYKPFTINNQKQTEHRRNLRRSQTPQETLLWQKLRARQTGYKWKRQVSVNKYILDFFCTEKKLAIELDGIQHDDAKSYDEKRSAYLKTQGITVIRFWNNEVNTNIDGVLAMIMSELQTSP